jgi:hypothetical protein
MATDAGKAQRSQDAPQDRTGLTTPMKDEELGAHELGEPTPDGGVPRPFRVGRAEAGSGVTPVAGVPASSHRGERQQRHRALHLSRDQSTHGAAEVVGKVLTIAALVGMTVWVIWQIRPDLIFSHAMDVGGDNGGHVAAPYFLIHHLLSQGRIEGWDPQWFDGFPLYVFYFPLPAVLIALLSVAFPYAVAFKLVTVLGSVTLPVAAWAFGRLAGFRRPVPVLMAAAMLPYLFNTSYTIDGGNLTSTLAGEFSFSLALSTGMLFLGVFAYALRTGRLRWLAAVLFAVTVLCHVVPALAFAGVAVLLALSRTRWRVWRILLPVGVVGALLAAFWLLPFGADLQYSSSMGYLRIPGIVDNLVPSGFIFMVVPAALGAFIALVRRDRFAIALAIAGAGAGLCFAKLPSGLVYNGRWLPFWFLFVSLEAAFGLGELSRAIGSWLALRNWETPVTVVAGTVGCLAGAAIAGGLTGAFPFVSPNATQTQVQGWVAWNYTGFQGKSGWPQFKAMYEMMDRAAARYGCGRLQYEYIKETNLPFGSTEAMMSLPLWTRGCIEDTDGIYFESSTTTPFHFLNVSEVSQNGEAPDPVSGLTYPGFHLADGIRHLQLMGDRYFFAMSPPVETAASADPSLQLIGTTTGFPGSVNGLADPHPVWKLYLIKASPLVRPLADYPVVEQLGAKAWLNLNLSWYESESHWPVELARSGPSSWPRSSSARLVPANEGLPAPQTSLSGVRTTDSSLSFHVTRLHTPVLVKIPYFPNWEAVGAAGPYEVSPNLMVVVPTAHKVTLVYGTSKVDWAGKIASLVGAVGLGMLVSARSPEMGRDLTTTEPAGGNLATPQPTGGNLATPESTEGGLAMAEATEPTEPTEPPDDAEDPEAEL